MRRQRLVDIDRIAQVVVVVNQGNQPRRRGHGGTLNTLGKASTIGQFMMLGNYRQHSRRQTELHRSADAVLDMLLDPI